MSVEVKALEERGTSVLWSGDGAMNPFWSETAREEALLRSMRLLELPAPGDEVVAVLQPAEGHASGDDAGHVPEAG